MSRDFDKAQEMVWASMEYVKVLGFRLRRTEVQRDDWKKVAQSHADELIKCRQQIDALKKERDKQSVLIEEQRRLLAAKQTEIGALEAERDDLRKIVEMVHADLGIQRGDHVGEAISELKKEASDATARQRMTEARALKYSLQAKEARREIERLRVEAFDPDAVRALQDERDALKRDVERLNGIKPELPPRDGRGEGLPRYGLLWNGSDRPVATPMDDGFWVPWYLAQKEVERIKADFKAEASERDEAVKELRESTQENKTLSAEVESLCAKLAAKTVQWPEWAKEGTRVVVKSCDSYCTDASIGFEFVIAEIDRGDSTVGDGKGTWASIFDLEPVAEHTQPTIEYVDRVGVRQEDEVAK